MSTGHFTDRRRGRFSEARLNLSTKNFMLNQLLVPLRYLASLENHCLIEDYYFLQSDLSMIQEVGGI